MRLAIVDSKLVKKQSKGAKVGYSSRLKIGWLQVHLELRDGLLRNPIITPVNVTDIDLIDYFLEENYTHA